MKHRFLPRLSLALFLLAAGCAGENQPAPPSDDASAEPPETEQAATKTDTIYVEGEPTPLMLRRYDEANLPFTTYLPEGEFQPATSAVGGGQLVRFAANFGGTPSPDVYVSFLFPSEAVGTVEALAMAVEDTIAARGWALTDHDAPERTAPCPWAEAHYTYRDESGEPLSTGYACLGQHAGRPFALLTHVPVPYSEGFGPRLALLLDHFRWRDTGESLPTR